MSKSFYRALLSILWCTPSLQAKTDEPEKVGNFLLPTSQQTGPLYGFGQNIVDKGDKLVFVNVNQLLGRTKNLSLIAPGFLYGIWDNLSLFIFTPIVAHARDGCNRSHGISDIWVQFEYAFVNQKTETTNTQATLVGSILLPTGSAKKNPNTGFGSGSFFLGGTLSYSTQWLSVWLQGAGLLTTKHHATKVGNNWLYQIGLEKCFTTYHGWMVAGMLEGVGFYSQRDKICGVFDNNSGSNTFYLAPSLWASSQTWIIQLGAAVPVLRQVTGTQTRYGAFLNLNIGYKF